MNRLDTSEETRTDRVRRAPSRRDVLRTTGIVAISGGAVLTLAACGGEGRAGTPVLTSAAPSSAASGSAASSPSASSRRAAV